MQRLIAALDARVRRAPRDTVLATSSATWSALRLRRTIDRVAEQLRGHGVRRLGLLADNSPGWAVVDIAAQLAGVVLVPLPTYFTESQLAWTASEAGLDALCSAARPASSTFPVDSTRQCLTLVGDLQLHWLTPPQNLPPVPAGCAKITFTSGSTGRPKGVCLAASQCLNVAEALLARTGLREGRHLAILPLATLLENIAGLYLPLLGGGCALLPAPREVGLDGSAGLVAAQLLTAISSYRPTSLILVPELLRMLVSASAVGWRPPDSLGFVAVGGARVAPDLLARARSAGLPVYEGYGLSECASVVSLNAPGVDRPGTSGKVLPHLRVQVHEGRLRVGGNAFLGYLGDPDSWHPRRVETGDLAEVSDDGYITVAGRDKHLIVTTFGRNISPEWVESELLAGGELAQAMVVGEGQAACAALVFPTDPLAPDSVIERQVARANRALPDYARLRAWHRLPVPLSAAEGLLTDNGRLRRAAIQARYDDVISSLFNTEESTSA